MFNIPTDDDSDDYYVVVDDDNDDDDNYANDNDDNYANDDGNDDDNHISTHHFYEGYSSSSSSTSSITYTYPSKHCCMLLCIKNHENKLEVMYIQNAIKQNHQQLHSITPYTGLWTCTHPECIHY